MSLTTPTALESGSDAILKPSSLELLQVRLERFGTHKNRTVRFGTGLNLIHGPNASGKSTIASALFFALSGHTLEPSARPGDHAQDGSGVGTVSLDFKASGVGRTGSPARYRVVRTTAGDVSVFEGESAANPIGSTSNRSRTAVQQLLGVDAHRLALAHFLREEEVGHFLSQTAGERKDLLRAALSLDDWERALKIFREARRLARNRHKEVAGALHQLAEPLEGPEARIAVLRQTVDSAEEARRLLLESEGGERLEELGHAKRRAFALERELDEVLFPLPSAAHLVAEISKLDDELEKLSTLDSDLAAARQQLGELLGLQQGASSDLSRLRSLLDAGERHCPTCEQALDLSLIQSLIDSRQRTLDGLVEETTASRGRLEKSEALEREREEARRRHADLRVKREKVRALTTDLESVLLWVEGARSQISGEAASRLVELQDQIDTGRAEIESLLLEQGAASERREQLRSLRDRSLGTNRMKLRLEASVEALEGALSEVAEGWFTPLERRLGSLVQGLGILGNAGVDVHSNPMRPRMLEGGTQRDFAALSGSERALVYLCFKAALSETVGIVPFLILDEPTAHLDAERKTRLVRLLRQLAGTRKQVLLTSNDPWLVDNLPEAHLIQLTPQ